MKRAELGEQMCTQRTRQTGANQTRRRAGRAIANRTALCTRRRRAVSACMPAKSPAMLPLQHCVDDLTGAAQGVRDKAGPSCDDMSWN